jgi:hypothetical protein
MCIAVLAVAAKSMVVLESATAMVEEGATAAQRKRQAMGGVGGGYVRVYDIYFYLVRFFFSGVQFCGI